MNRTVIFDMHHIIYQKALPKPGAKPDRAKLPVKEMPQALDTFLQFLDQGYKLVIISSSGIQHSRDVLVYLLSERGYDQEEIRQILQKIDILTMRYFGSKHSADSWQKAMEPYQNIDYIFEDGEEKLKAAGQAARALGSDPDLFTSVADFCNAVEE
jgi:hypothetical protein